MPTESEPACVMDTARRIAAEWENEPPDVSWEEDRAGIVVFSGTCPIDGTYCKVLVDFSRGKAVVPRVVAGSDQCDQTAE